jgi:hypothetical protein
MNPSGAGFSARINHRPLLIVAGSMPAAAQPFASNLEAGMNEK